MILYTHLCKAFVIAFLHACVVSMIFCPSFFLEVMVEKKKTEKGGKRGTREIEQQRKKERKRLKVVGREGEREKTIEGSFEITLCSETQRMKGNLR